MMEEKVCVGSEVGGDWGAMKVVLVGKEGKNVQY